MWLADGFIHWPKFTLHCTDIMYAVDPQAEFFKNYGWLEKKFG